MNPDEAKRGFISIHAPLTGSDDYLFWWGQAVFFISIHAPLTGSDQSRTSLITLMSYFNPRSPHRERPERRHKHTRKLAFQSTLPSQGATLYGLFHLHCTMISIHAPLTGSDVPVPLTVVLYLISIHAPLTGSDFSAVKKSYMIINFNPRSPHRERQILEMFSAVASDFNPRSPHRERLVPFIAVKDGVTFQSTLPSQGATKAVDTWIIPLFDFNPRSPHRERQQICT